VISLLVGGPRAFGQKGVTGYARVVGMRGRPLSLPDDSDLEAHLCASFVPQLSRLLCDKPRLIALWQLLQNFYALLPSRRPPIAMYSPVHGHCHRPGLGIARDTQGS